MKTIKTVKFLEPDGRPDPSWLVFTAPTWAEAEERAWSAARAAAPDGISDPAHTIPNEMRFRTILLSANDEVHRATWRSPGTSPPCLARDASLMVRALLFDDEEESRGYVKTAQAHWEVWRKGYGLACESNGQLYVFRKQPGFFEKISLRPLMELLRAD